MRLKSKQPTVSGAAKAQSSHGPTAAEMYELNPATFVRFDEKQSMFAQQYWNPTVEAERKEGKAKRIRLGKKGHPAYDRLAWGVAHATESFLDLTGSRKMGGPDCGPTAWKSSYFEDDPEEREPWQATLEESAAAVRKAGKMFGANEVGFAHLDRRWVFAKHFDTEKRESYPVRFSDEPGYEHHSSPVHLEDGSFVIPKEMTNVVVLLHEWAGGTEAVDYAPTLLTYSVSLNAYAKFTPTIWMLAEFIRSLGYQAIPCGNDIALSIPLAVDAGLGQVGRNSSLINPKYGSRCRISKIITDMPLPHDGAKNFGVTEFCNVCQKCALKCGGKAIPTGERSFQAVNESNISGVRLWMVDAKKCSDYQNRAGTTCSICVRMCPWTKGHHWVHPTARWAMRNLRWNWLNRFWVWLDDVLGYGEYKRSPAMFWFDDEPTHRWLVRRLRAAPRIAKERIGMRRRQLSRERR